MQVVKSKFIELIKFFEDRNIISKLSFDEEENLFGLACKLKSSFAEKYPNAKLKRMMKSNHYANNFKDEELKNVAFMLDEIEQYLELNKFINHDVSVDYFNNKITENGFVINPESLVITAIESLMIMYTFINKIDEEKATLLYTQVLNGCRVKKHKVTYIFDEVGCGKTVSAIMAMAAVIEEKKNGYKILVLTPKNVCNQFENEIKEKLKVSDDEEKNLDKDNPIIVNISGYTGDTLENEIEKIKASENKIAISNPHSSKAKALESIKWDLIIIDEAHSVVCNNKEQRDTYIRKVKDCEKQEIEDIYKDISLEDCCEEYFRKNSILINNISYNNRLVLFYKSILIEEYNKEFKLDNHCIGFLNNSRYTSNKTFDKISKLKAEKLMFLTATKYYYDKEFDFINYGFLAKEILREGESHEDKFNFEYMPDFSWIKDFYTLNSVDKMEKSNTSYMFKEIAQDVKLDIKDEENQSGKEESQSGKEESQSDKEKSQGKNRKVEIWDELGVEEKNLLRDKLLGENGILKNKKRKNKDKNRVIIFVSNRGEGKAIFKKLFPNANYDIASVSNKNTYIEDGIKCKFIMNLFGNTKYLKYYAKEEVSDDNKEGNNKIHSEIGNQEEEKEKIPDILIVTYQSTQVGINLPTYNYVINYHIPKTYGDLEQRFGRIDRLNSKKSYLYNIYYLEAQFNTYRHNLTYALYDYMDNILDEKGNLPVKNLLISEGLKFIIKDISSYYNSLASYLNVYIEEELYEESTLEEYLLKVQEKFKDEDIQIIKEENSVKIITKDGEYYSSDIDINEEDEIINDNFEESSDNKEENNNLKGSEVENQEDENRDKCKIKEKINELIEDIKDYKNINDKKEALNNAEDLGEAGSIIFWNEEEKKVTVQCKKIVENINEHKTCNLKFYNGCVIYQERKDFYKK